jgi:hypothetical protein
MTPAERRLIWFLRLTALLLIAAAGAVLLPSTWMNAIHEWLGLGALPDMPMVGYMTRSVSALYACLGAGCWYVSRNVRRYLPLLRFSLPVSFAFALTLIAIDVHEEMPLAWTLGEGAFLLGWTLALWRLVRN